MDLFRLGPYDNANPTYLPDKVIEGYTSAIWTERFLDPGDFVIKTPYVEETLALLPEMTFISHRHTREVMQVESHLVTEDEYGNEELTIVGRSVDTIFESRHVEGVYQKRRQMARAYGPHGAALVLIWNSVANGSGFDVSRRRQDDNDENNNDPDHDGPQWPWTTKDMLPNVAVSDSVVNGEPNEKWWLTEGPLYPQLIKILKRGDLGIRTIRPPSAASSSSEKVWIRSGLENLGEIVRDTTFNFQELRFDVFQGTDRSHLQTANSKVVFNVLHNHIDKPSHLWSTKEWKTALEIMSSLNRKKDIYRSGQSGFTGWQRRVMSYDAGAPELPPEPDRPDRDASDAAWDKYRTKHANWKRRRDREIDQFVADYEKDGLRALNAFRKVSLFSGDILPDAPYVYKKDYNLGDTVTLKGRYGLVETAIVTEYVRTEDAEGDRGYPGLTIEGA